MIYADNAATTPLCREAFEAMKPFLLNDYANASQPYSFARAAKKALKEARETIALCIGSYPDEIFFTSGGTESNNWAVKCASNGEREEIITSRAEHHSVLNSCAALERAAVPVKYVSTDKCGVVSREDLKSKISDGTKLVSVMLANNEIGTIQPIAELAEIAHNIGALFHTDAVQALGHINTDVKDLDIDLLSASAHKFNGPKGAGFLYVKRGTQITPLLDGGSQEKALRAGTENIAAIAAMAAALKKNCADIDENFRKLKNLEEEFLNILKANRIDFIKNGGEKTLPGNISISIKGADGEMLLHRMDLKGICISTGSACDSKNAQLSHVIREIGLGKAYARGTVRISFGSQNTPGDAVRTAEAIAEIAGDKL